MTNPPALCSLCHTDALQQVCGTGYSQGSTALRTWSARHTQILSPPIYSQIKTEGKPRGSRLQVPEQSDSESSRRRSREGSPNSAAELRGAGPAPGTAGHCCWAQNNDFTLLMPHPQSTAVCATQRLIEAPVAFVGCYSLVSCMERHGIRKSFHPDAGILILQLSRERTE